MRISDGSSDVCSSDLPTADRIGLQAAEAMGQPPERVLKTLMALVDGKPVCVILPSDREVSMKKLAAVFRGKSAQMMKPADAERLTGYKVGGISPFRQKRKVPTAIEAEAMAHLQVFINGGQRGRSEEHTSELQSLMRISYAVFCLKKKKQHT